MTRNEKKIRVVAAEVGIKIESVAWEPLGTAMEMCGPSGGWIVIEKEPVPPEPLSYVGEWFTGYNVAEVCQQIREHGAEVLARRKAVV